MDKEINARIKHYRNLKKMTQEELGMALGMKCSTYSQMERRGKITVDMAKAIAKILDVDSDVIIYGNPIDFTPIETPPLILEDSGKSNMFFSPAENKEPEITVSYKSGDLTLSVMEELIISRFRDMDSKEQQKFIDYINELSQKRK